MDFYTQVLSLSSTVRFGLSLETTRLVVMFAQGTVTNTVTPHNAQILCARTGSPGSLDSRGTSLHITLHTLLEKSNAARLAATYMGNEAKKV